MYNKSTIIIVALSFIAAFCVNTIIIITTVEIYNKINSSVEIEKEYLTFSNSDGQGVGQIWANDSTLTMYGYSNRDIEIGAGNGVIINTGSGDIELRQSNDTKIRIGENRIDINTDNLYINGEKIDPANIITRYLEEMSKDISDIDKAVFSNCNPETDLKCLSVLLHKLSN